MGKQEQNLLEAHCGEEVDEQEAGGKESDFGRGKILPLKRKFLAWFP